MTIYLITKSLYHICTNFILHISFQGEDVIAILPWEEWWEFEVKKDDSNPHIALLPLHPDLRAKFNETAAWEYAKSMAGMPYGYHNLIFSWIDTIDGNYPSPLDANLVMHIILRYSLANFVLTALYEAACFHTVLYFLIPLVCDYTQLFFAGLCPHK